MFELACAYCGNILYLDKPATLARYLNEVDYIKDSREKICDIALNSFLLYSCINCTKTYRYTLADVEKLVREGIRDEVAQYRKNYVIKNDVTMGSVDPDNGLEYCGRCAGVDEEGNCYVDIIRQCSFRDDNEL